MITRNQNIGGAVLDINHVCLTTADRIKSPRSLYDSGAFVFKRGKGVNRLVRPALGKIKNVQNPEGVKGLSR